MLKYEIQHQFYQLPGGRKVYRIRALRDFGNVKAGTIGGFVETYDNLMHDGLCWIADNAMALGRSRVSRDAQLRDRARLSEWAAITDECVVQDDAQLRDYSLGYGHAVIGVQSVLADVVTVRDRAVVLCRSRFSVSGKSRVPNLRGHAMIRDDARLEGSISVRDHVTVGDHAIVRDSVRLLERAHIGGESVIEGRAVIGEEAAILKQSRIGGRTKIFGRVFIVNNVPLPELPRLRRRWRE